MSGLINIFIFESIFERKMRGVGISPRAGFSLTEQVHNQRNQCGTVYMYLSAHVIYTGTMQLAVCLRKKVIYCFGVWTGRAVPVVQRPFSSSHTAARSHLSLNVNSTGTVTLQFLTRVKTLSVLEIARESI